MTQFLPDNLLSLFAPRPPLDYKSPPDELIVDRKQAPILGIAQYVGLFEDSKDTPPKPHVETRDEKRARIRKDKKELLSYKIEQGIATWAPAKNPEATLDPYKTLFVARISYETSESKLRREFERYGNINKVVLVNDKKGKPKGYAFLEFAHKSDMSSAYKKGDGAKIDGRRVVVDYERGRTQKQWLPRRLGGGKGETRRDREPKNVSRDDDHRDYGSIYSRDSHSRGYSRDGSDHRNGSSRPRSRSHERSNRSSGGDRYDRGDRHNDRHR